MAYQIDYAYTCHTGKVRTNNEDNFWCCGVRLPVHNQGVDGILAGHTQLHHFFFCEIFSRIIFHEACEIFHADKNIPSDLVQIFHHLVIFYRYNMGISPEILHGAYFLNALLHQIFKITADRFFITGF